MNSEFATNQPEGAKNDLAGTILDDLPAMVCHLDCGFNYLYTNKSYRAWAGTQDFIVENRALPAVLPANISTTVLEHAKLAMLGEKHHLQVAIPAKNDVLSQSIQFSFSPLAGDDGHISGITVMISILNAEGSNPQSISADTASENQTLRIDERQEELRRSEERYHKMIAEVEDYAILLLDRDGIIRNWNIGAEKIKGYKESEIIGKSFKIFYQKKEQERGLPDELINEAVTKGKAIHEGWRVKKDGSAFWGSVVITSLHNDQGGIIGFTKVTRDLTERKLAEDKMKRYAQELEFQNKELEQFAYVASHDMKEPLRKIIFYNTFISESAASLLPEREHAYFQKSINAAKRMQMLIEDLLTYAKTTFHESNFEMIDLNVVIADLIILQRDDPWQEDVTIETEPLPVVRGIGFQLRQLFENILGNAVKYRHPERHPRIKITCVSVEGNQIDHPDADKNTVYHKISVEDNGQGFNQSHAEKIFELFQRLGVKTESSGTGIGLTLCRRIVQTHKGFISATGKADMGAVFAVFLPDIKI